MAVEPFDVFDKEGLKTLSSTTFKIVDINYLKKADAEKTYLTQLDAEDTYLKKADADFVVTDNLPKEVLHQLLLYDWTIKREDGCLYLSIPEGIDDDAVDAWIAEHTQGDEGG